MSSDQVIEILMDRVKVLEKKDDRKTDLINELFVIVGKMTVKTTMIVSIFSTIGGGISILLLKFVFKAF
jgi:hypothetical protein